MKQVEWLDGGGEVGKGRDEGIRMYDMMIFGGHASGLDRVLGSLERNALAETVLPST